MVVKHDHKVHIFARLPITIFETNGCGGHLMAGWKDSSLSVPLR